MYLLRIQKRRKNKYQIHYIYHGIIPIWGLQWLRGHLNMVSYFGFPISHFLFPNLMFVKQPLWDHVMYTKPLSITVKVTVGSAHHLHLIFKDICNKCLSPDRLTATSVLQLLVYLNSSALCFNSISFSYMHL